MKRAVIVGDPAHDSTVRLAKLLESRGIDVSIVTRYWNSASQDGIKVVASSTGANPETKIGLADLQLKLLDVEKQLSDLEGAKYTDALGPLKWQECRYSFTKSMLEALSIAPVVRDLNPDIVFGQEIFNYGLAAALCSNCPRVMVPWGGDIYRAAESSAVGKALVKYALSNAELILASSKEAADFICNRYSIDQNRTATLNPGVDTAAFQSASENERIQICARYSIDPNSTICTNLRPFKAYWGSSESLDAFLKVASNNQQTHFFLLGGTGTQDSIRRAQHRIASKNLQSQFTILDHEISSRALQEVFAITDICVSLPKYRDLRVARIFEAGAAAAAPVLTEVEAGHCAEGFKAQLCAPGDAEAVVSAIERYLSDPNLRKETVDANQRFVSSCANEEQQMSALLNAAQDASRSFSSPQSQATAATDIETVLNLVKGALAEAQSGMSIGSSSVSATSQPFSQQRDDDAALFERMRGFKFVFAYPNYDSRRARFEENAASRLSAKGFDVSAFGIPCPGGWYPFPKLDQAWRAQERSLMSAYEQLGMLCGSNTILVANGGSMVHPGFLEQCDAYKVFICGDDPESSDILSRPVAPWFDYCLPMNVAEIGKYWEWGCKKVEWLFFPLRADLMDPSLTEERIRNEERDIDISLLCERVSGLSDRAKRVEKLIEAFPNAFVRGRGWPGGYVDEVVPVYLRSKIGWNLHNSTGPINLRTVTLPALGVMQICDNKEHLGAQFVLDKEVVGFSTLDECIEKTHYYLAHDEERKEIAVAGWKRTMKDYTEEAWWHKLLSLIDADITDRAGIPSEAPVQISSPVPQPDAPDKPLLFKDETQVYLASADRMDKTLENLGELEAFELETVDVYATVIGGLSGLNYLSQLKPKRIVFYDVNEYALDYARLIVEMISVCESPEDFINRMFARRIDSFLTASGKSTLNLKNQDRYLEQSIDNQLLEDTLGKLSTVGQETFRRIILPHLRGNVPAGPRNCRRLLPCWPDDEIVPVGGGEELGDDGHGNLVPNTNTFFYGKGWLSSSETFLRVKTAVTSAPIKYTPFDLVNSDERILFSPDEDVVIHISNIDDWFPEETTARLLDWAQKRSTLFVVVTSHNGVMVNQPDPHEYAYRAIKPYVEGSVVEVTHKVPWGFHEFERENVFINDYLQGHHPADTTIIHILIGEGMPRLALTQALEKSLPQSKKVLVLEHDRDSIDWIDTNNEHMASREELTSIIAAATGSKAEEITCIPIRGERDSKRNLLYVLDGHTKDQPKVTAPSPRSLSLSVLGEKDGFVHCKLGDLTMKLIRGRYLDDQLMQGNLFEQESVVAMSKLIPPGAVVLDVGANFGYYTLLFSSWVTVQGRVIAFEPTDEYGDRLRDNIALNNLSNVMVETVGLSNKKGTAQISIGQCSATCHWVFEDQKPRNVEEIHLTTLDDWWAGYVERGNPDRLDVIKVDLDGHEPLFLQGAAETVKKHRPIILIEFFQPQYADAGISCEDVIDFLHGECNYSFYDLERLAMYDDMAYMRKKLNDLERSYNVICLPA